MPLLPGAELLGEAVSKGYALGAFNISNLENLQAAVRAAIELKSPMFIGVTEGAAKYAGLEYLAGVAKLGVKEAGLPMALHLDHGQDLKVIEKAIKCGFTSVMIDASRLPLEENIEMTREVVKKAHPKGVSVEAELGRIGGREDDLSVSEREATMVVPQLAARFVEETGIDSLAPAVGTVHGAFKYKGEAHLDFERLKKVRELTGLPLVLHGASGVPRDIVEMLTYYGGEVPGAKGLPDKELKKAIPLGVAKVNIDTDLRLAFTAALRRVLIEEPEEFDPRKILGPARELMKEVVMRKMKVLGSAGRA
ncbi:MAG: class II fructose-1,6-bisphosphate aldolase [Nitrospinota bacterium]